MDMDWLVTALVQGTLQGAAAGAALIAGLYTLPSTAPWMWLLTAVSLVTGGTSVRRRRKHRYR
jgi:hypothetical protein